jgi:hypothetical protein
MDLFAIVPILIGLGFVLVIGGILFQIVRGIGQWSYNNGQPVLSEPARLVSKRQETSGSVSSNTGGTVSTTYYVTFELPSGERREFRMGGRDFGVLAEGDEGNLVYQGTRFKGFDRTAARHSPPNWRAAA